MAPDNGKPNPGEVLRGRVMVTGGIQKVPETYRSSSLTLNLNNIPPYSPQKMHHFFLGSQSKEIFLSLGCGTEY